MAMNRSWRAHGLFLPPETEVSSSTSGRGEKVYGERDVVGAYEMKPGCFETIFKSSFGWLWAAEAQRS